MFMPFGAVAAVVVVVVQWATHSGFVDIGGAIDWIVLLGVAGAGAIGSAILVYTVQSLTKGRQSADHMEGAK
ncbi:DUF5368 family protein [uncultured Thioclava sp.]|uniref:DUF5368 family protein n=1 Tax=uncultured Thioclava sp. TaxID=473858 RepID=UPI0025EBBF1D|nr:DUF5368 family protein [uncultured Thioclava sp.]